MFTGAARLRCSLTVEILRMPDVRETQCYRELKTTRVYGVCGASQHTNDGNIR